MDSIHIHQTITLPIGKTTMPFDIDGYAVISNDSLHNALYGISDLQVQQGQTLDVLTTKVNEISEYGVGYHDSVGIIAIPLIIALFAFALPLLFQVITHINSKYSSPSISEMFENTHSYKMFWIISKSSMGYLLIMGVSFLFFKGEVYKWLMSLSNWIGLFVAIAYVTTTLRFIKTCIRFNDPQKLLPLIVRQYKEDLKNDDYRVALHNLKHIKDKFKFWKSNGWKSFKNYHYRMFGWFAHYKSNTDYSKRIVDICKYAMSKRDNTLFTSVIGEVEKITKKEKVDKKIAPVFSVEKYEEPLYLPFTNTFYKEIIDYYTHCDENSDYEDRLLRSWMNSFSRCRFPYEKGIVEIIRTIVSAVEAGRIGVYEKYVRHSGFDYLFIQSLQTTAFIQGADCVAQISFDSKRRAVWNRVCDLHFMMNAYLLTRGHYEILKPLLSANCYFQGHLYAMGPHEYLACYANCKKEVHEGGYHYWSNKDMFGREIVDSDMLEKFTVSMMLLTSPMPSDVRAIVSDDCIKKMKESKPLLLDYSNKIQRNSELVHLFPQIKNVLFEELLDTCIKAYEDGTILEKKDGEYEEQPGFWSSLVGSVESFLCTEWNSKSKCKQINLYSAILPKESKRKFENDVMNVFRNTGWISQGLVENSNKGIVEHIIMQPLCMLINKRYMYYYSHESSFHLQRHYEILFENRMTYMVYTAINNMDISYKSVRICDFEDFFNSYTHGNNSDYVIIDNDCDFSSNLERESNQTLGNWLYKGADYKMMYLKAKENLKDTPVVKLFNNSLLIIKKEDYPSLFKIDKNDSPVIDMTDSSDSTRGIAAIKVTVRSNMELRYYSSSKVVLVKLTI